MAATELVFVGIDKFIEGLEAFAVAADEASKAIVTKGGHVLEANTKARMNGRPGPNVITGTLRRSVSVVTVERVSAATWRSKTGPTTVYGRRIELGFRGTDSLGRRYNQPGYPSLSPAIQASGPELAAVYRAAWAAAFRSA